jgi:hypothetical protein
MVNVKYLKCWGKEKVAIMDGHEIILLLSSIATALTIYLTTRKKKLDKKSEDIINIETIEGEVLSLLPGDIEKKLDTTQDTEIKKNIKIENLEKEIVNYVSMRLLKAETEGKISYEDRMQLVKKYSLEIQPFEDQISNIEMNFLQQEYMPTQEDPKKKIEGKYNEISDTINNVKNNLETFPEEEVKEFAKSSTGVLPRQQKGRTFKRKASTQKKKSQKSKAEERIEKIQNEVLNILAQIEEMEIEG